ELYCVNFTNAWLPAGLYHYDRAGHHLSQIAAHADRAHWQTIVPSLPLVEGGSLVWVLVGDGARVEKKYGPRGYRFLLLEAGHRVAYLLASQDLTQCVRYEDQFPPFSGDVPAHWRALPLTA